MRHITRQLLIGSAAALAVALAAIAALAQQPLPVPVDGNVAQWQALDVNTVLVLSAEDNNLWLEYAPFGTVPLPECVYPNTQQCRYWIASGAGELSVLDQHSIFVNGAALGSMLSFYNLVGIVP